MSYKMKLLAMVVGLGAVLGLGTTQDSHRQLVDLQGNFVLPTA